MWIWSVGFLSEGRLGFEETAYLLLFGKLPTEAQLGQFNEILQAQQSLPEEFCPGCSHEGSQQGYDEYPVQERQD